VGSRRIKNIIKLDADELFLIFSPLSFDFKGEGITYMEQAFLAISPWESFVSDS
jgi:hypothetical protein